MTKIPPFLRPAGTIDFRQPEIPGIMAIDFDQPPEKAIEFFKAKGLKTSFSYADVFLDEHDKAFTVAKMMDVDLLADTRAALDKAIAEGKTFKQFSDDLVPTLVAKGWWGKKTVFDPVTGLPMQVQLGSPARLRTIYRSNMASSMAVGHWQQAQANKHIMPYLRYDAIEDHRTRDEHRILDGIIRPVDDPFWSTHYPPNGYNCRCTTIPLSDADLEANGWTITPEDGLDFGTVEWLNPNTGEILQIPRPITPGWNHNPGLAQVQQLAQLHVEKIEALPWSDLRTAALRAKGIELPTIAERVAALKGAQAASTAAAANTAAAQELDEIAAGSAVDPAKWKAQSLKTLAKEPGWDNLPPSEQLAAVLAKAAEKKATNELSTKLYQYKQAVIKGKVPGKAAADAFKSADPAKQAKILAQIDEATAAAKEKAAQEAAQAELDGIIAGTVKDPAGWKAQSHKKLSKIPGFANGSPKEQLDAVLAHANDLKAKNVLSGKLSQYKKAHATGKKPPPAAQAAFDSLSDADAKAFEIKAANDLVNKAEISAADKTLIKAQITDDGWVIGDKLPKASAAIHKAKATPAPAAGSSLTDAQVDDVVSEIGTPGDIAGIDTTIAGVLDETPAVTSSTAAVSRETLNVNRMHQVGPQRGSNAGGLFQDPTTGERWYVKLAASEDIARNEVLASKIYAEMGIDVPELRLVDIDIPTVGTGKGIASRWADGLESVSGQRLAAKKIAGARENLAVDAWLANWDVAGQGFDNLILNGNRAVRIDVGGALRYRAQGGIKGGGFGRTVGELESLRDPRVNPQTATVFKGTTQAELEAGVRKVLAFEDTEIVRLVRRYGPTDAAIADELIDILKARRDDLARRFPHLVEPSAPAPLPKMGGFLAPDELVKIEQARGNGYVRVTDSGDLEDQHLLVYHVETPTGTETRAWFKVHGEAAEKLHETAGKAASRAARANTIVDSTQADNSLLEAIIGIASDKNPTVRAKDIERVKVARAKVDELSRALSKAKGAGLMPATEALEMNRYYRKIVAEAEKAVAGGIDSPMTWSGGKFEKMGLRVIEPPKPSGTSAGLSWNGVVHTFEVNTTTDGAIQVGARSSKVSTQAATTTHGKATITYMTGETHFALRDTVEIRIPGTAKDAAGELDEALRALGIRTHRATAADREELYLLQTLAQTNQRNDAIDRIRAKPDQATRIAEFKAELESFAGRKVSKMPAYRPDGQYQAFDSGRKNTFRPDLEGMPAWAKFQAEYRLHHETTTGDLVETIRNVLNSGGQMAPTVDKLRRGITIGGMSPEADLRTGGASYFFTRIQTKAVAERRPGFSWKSRQIARLDSISYSGDKFGRTTGDTVRSNRKGTIDEWRQASSSGSNETIFKNSLSLFDDLEYIVTKNESERQQIMQVFRDAGYPAFPDGRSLDDVVVVAR